MRSSIPLYNHLAADYESHFQAPHRQAYDQLSWELVMTKLDQTPKVIVDAGCGVGRWARKLVKLGHLVIGIEQAPAMIAAAKQQNLGSLLEIIESSIEEAQLPEASVDMVLAMGSLQYTMNPQEIIVKFTNWLKPGGHICLLYDSLVGMVLELLNAGKTQEALERLFTQKGIWVEGEHSAELHLMHSEQVENYCHQAGLIEIRSHGLLINASTLGKNRLIEQLQKNPTSIMALERQLLQSKVLADMGKQILTLAKKPIVSSRKNIG